MSLQLGELDRLEVAVIIIFVSIRSRKLENKTQHRMSPRATHEAVSLLPEKAERGYDQAKSPKVRYDLQEMGRQVIGKSKHKNVRSQEFVRLARMSGRRTWDAR